MSAVQQYFGAIYRDDDPFGYRERWYEARKRDLLLASLPRARFAHAWELGCSNGELTAALAPRCWPPTCPSARWPWPCSAMRTPRTCRCSRPSIRAAGRRAVSI